MAADDPNPFDAIDAGVAGFFQELGRDVGDTVRQRLSVDVEYESGTRGGRVAVRSRSGEIPRREGGDLYKSIAETVTVAGHVVALEVGSDVDHAFYLQETMNRPIFVGLDDAYEPVILDGLARIIRGG